MERKAKKISWRPSGVCPTEIRLDIINGRVYNLTFVGGCPGNTFGISQLVNGMDVKEVVDKLEGIRCGTKDTSCPDQLAKLLRTEWLEEDA